MSFIYQSIVYVGSGRVSAVQTLFASLLLGYCFSLLSHLVCECFENVLDRTQRRKTNKTRNCIKRRTEYEYEYEYYSAVECSLNEWMTEWIEDEQTNQRKKKLHMHLCKYNRDVRELWWELFQPYVCRLRCLQSTLIIIIGIDSSFILILPSCRAPKFPNHGVAPALEIQWWAATISKPDCLHPSITHLLINWYWFDMCDRDRKTKKKRFRMTTLSLWENFFPY